MRLPPPVHRALAAALLAASLAAAAPTAAAPRRDSAQSYRSLDTFAEVLAYVENHYVDEVKEKEMVYAAIDGMLQHLDPHSVLLRPDVYRAMKDETRGEFDGIGAEVAIRDEALVVVAPFPDSPAERAGLRPGDRIVSVDGASTRDMSLEDAVRRMKGPAGTKVVVEIMRPVFREPLQLTLVRDHVRTSAVEWSVADAAAGIVHVRIRTFQDRTDRQLQRALAEARTRLGGEIRGLVLDLRNNPGGLLDQAVRVSDRFLRSGVIVSTEGRGKAPEIERAHEKGTEPDYPVVVLVNRGSASASEIVAGALQDHGRATVLGTRSFGKGSVQTVIELDDGSAVKLTVAKYFTPRHRSIQDQGIIPDVVVADPPEPQPSSAPVSEPRPAPDLQLEAAVARLRTPQAGVGAPAPASGGASQ